MTDLAFGVVVRPDYSLLGKTVIVVHTEEELVEAVITALTSALVKSVKIERVIRI